MADDECMSPGRNQEEDITFIFCDKLDGRVAQELARTRTRSTRVFPVSDDRLWSSLPTLAARTAVVGYGLERSPSTVVEAAVRLVVPRARVLFM